MRRWLEKRLGYVWGYFRATGKGRCIFILRLGGLSDWVDFEFGILGHTIYVGRIR